jgi:hypothetical protein
MTVCRTAGYCEMVSPMITRRRSRKQAVK